MLISTYNILISVAFLGLLGAIIFYFVEYFMVKSSGSFEIWVYKYILAVMSAVIFFSMAGYAPQSLHCGVCTTQANVSGNITANTCTVQCTTETITPDAGQVWLYGSFGFLCVFLGISWGILAFAKPV